jgi:hypothetical protein
MKYTIRLCRRDELDKLTDFIRRFWKSNHVFLNEKKLLDWQHLEEHNYNFVVANYEPKDEFHGVLGFISPQFFSNGKVSELEHIWLAIWKVEKSLSVSNSIGIDLLNFIKERYRPKIISAIGINREVWHVYRLLGFKVGKLCQGYILNPKYKDFKIAQVKNFQDPGVKFEDPVNEASIIQELDLEKLSELRLADTSFKRCFGYEYIKQRFLNHPIYSYNVYAVRRGDLLLTIFIARIAMVSSSKCLRIVDFWGLENSDKNLYQAFVKLIVKEDCEYIDVISSKSDFTQLAKIGFTLNTEDSYVPHLFEPFLSDRSEVMFATNVDDDVPMFKADSDLDRPNIGVSK